MNFKVLGCFCILQTVSVVKRSVALAESTSSCTAPVLLQLKSSRSKHAPTPTSRKSAEGSAEAAESVKLFSSATLDETRFANASSNSSCPVEGEECTLAVALEMG